MNPSTAFGRVLVDELVRGGVTDAVLAPGSRSAPVAVALAAAERDGRLRLHVRIDERTAAFLALGLAKASGRPVPVLTTSGTAVAHLHAAVLEADSAGIPLLVLTADRPPELRATGANQTIEQPGLYGRAVRWAADVGVPEAGREAAQNRYWRSLVAKALIAATGALSGDPGPVHLNLALREPLLPESEEPADLPGPWAGRPGGAAWTVAGPAPVAPAEPPGPSRTLLVVGDAPPALGRAAAALADACHWPVIAEPSSGAWGAEGALRGGALLLGVPDWLGAHRPDRVLVVGRPTLSRPVSALLGDPDVQVETVAASPRWADAVRSSGHVSLTLPAAGGPLAEGWRPAGRTPRTGWAPRRTRCSRGDRNPRRRGWPATWWRPSRRVAAGARVVHARARRRPAGGAPRRRRGAGQPGRRRHRRHDLHGRGGGARARAGPAFALLGDLTFLHDLTGLLLGDGEPAPDLTAVVSDNDGGGIFAQLEPGEHRHARDYRRVFGTPHGRDVAVVAESLGWAATRVTDLADLPAALALGGPRVVVVRTDQRAEAELVRTLRQAAAGALA